MRRLGKSENEEEADVVFIMLIFFIVTASFVKETAIDINKPPASDNPPDPEAPKPIVVEINKLSEVRIANRLLDYRRIKPTITRLKAESPDSSVIVKVDPKAKTKAIIQAIDGIRQANVEQPTITMTSG